MKLLTLNFLTCATKDCRAAATSTYVQPDTDESSAASPFPLQVEDAELARTELDFQPLFWRNILPRIDWPAMRDVAANLGLSLPTAVVSRYLAAPPPDADVAMSDSTPASEAPGLVKVGGDGVDAPTEDDDFDEETLKLLHGILLETQVLEGSLACRRCGHKYAVKEGVANFLLPPHLV